ncbi:MAG: CehA/McbA family metallohydrolase, partial [Gammaproteobacteria bacterium]|nr:CehA/McbA family metallohydrolase [Gammaproteobacteria bacterium]
NVFVPHEEVQVNSSALRKAVFVSIATVALSWAAPSSAQRAPVLKQIDVPHDYYFREMYLPQTTTGPGSLGWSPDGEMLVYSMQGSLWIQRLDSVTARQVTNGPGYDYQPDWSADGNHIVFVRYNRDAMELQVLEVDTGTIYQLTSSGAVNVEPRWSPDGADIAYVSTEDSGRFHIRIGEIVNSKLQSRRLVKARKSKVSRYYYSEWDHQISPSWSPDGQELIYVANQEIPYGTGVIWRQSVSKNSKPVLARKEETAWKARPDWSPDGKRFVYASYLGRQWQQLWISAFESRAEPFPLSYGNFDISSPRWSPDGKRIAYISNRPGNTSIWIQDVVGGKSSELRVSERQYKVPVGQLNLVLQNAAGEPVAGRVSVVAADGRAYAPVAAWMHADDSYDRSFSSFETRYFHANGSARITLPSGPASVAVWRGLEHQPIRRSIDIIERQKTDLALVLEALPMPEGWDAMVSGDVHVHMNYGGTYRNTPDRLIRQMQAEDLDVVFNLIVNKEQRVPDIASFAPDPDPFSDDKILLMHSQEFHTSYWGHLGLLGLREHLLLPDYSGYPGTGAASIYPDNSTVSDMASMQGAVVGYVHPFLAPAPNPESPDSLTNALPVDVALSKVDYYEVVGFADHRASAEVWYRLLNTGFRIAAAGGTDAMANYASLRGPVGVNRTYVSVGTSLFDPAARRDAWLAGLKAGKTLATNGPLIGITVNDTSAGGEIRLDAGEHELKYSGFMRSIVPVDFLELVWNGQVVQSITTDSTRKSADFEGSITAKGSGWLLLRAWNEKSHPDVFDIYPYATTNPVFVTVDNKGLRSTKDADYFLAWIGRIRESAAAHPDYNSAEERDIVLQNLDKAQKVFESRR